MIFLSNLPKGFLTFRNLQNLVKRLCLKLAASLYCLDVMPLKQFELLTSGLRGSFDIENQALFYGYNS